MVRKPTASYGDVQPVMRQAVNSEGVRYRVKSFGAAINFRQRCYSYRMRLREIAAERMGEIPGADISIPEDSIYIRIEDMNGRNWTSKSPSKDKKKFPFDVVLTHRELEGQLLTLESEPIELDKDDSEVEDLGLG